MSEITGILMKYNLHLNEAPSKGRLMGAMNEYHKKELENIMKRVDAIPTKKIRMQVAHKYPGYEGSKEFIPKDIVMGIIKNDL